VFVVAGVDDVGVHGVVVEAEAGAGVVEDAHLRRRDVSALFVVCALLS
jgi:hypothetical protein